MRPVETEVIQTRSSEDSKSLNVEQTHDRTVRPVAALNTAEVQDSSRVRSAHESDTFNVDDVLRERMEKSIVVHDKNHEPMMVNEANMDFIIPGPPHSVVKHAQSTSVRELFQKIENHPDRHALQQDLRQNQLFNPFSPESKQMIRDVGNIELCELLETEPRTQCKVCLSYWNIGILYCTCGHFLRKGRKNHQVYYGPSFNSGVRGQGDGVPKAGVQLAAADTSRVPNLRVCEHPSGMGWHTQGEKDELTSCRGTV